METVFQKNYTIETIHLDRYGRVKPSVMLYFAQEAATGHCDLLSLDWDTLAKKRLFWAVIRHRLVVSRYPVAGETITVETWPMPTTRSAFPRATAAYDQNGNELFRCISLWILMDTETRAMVLPGKSGIEVNGLLRGSELTAPSSILPKAAHRLLHRPGQKRSREQHPVSGLGGRSAVQRVSPGAHHPGAVCLLPFRSQGGTANAAGLAAV